MAIARCDLSRLMGRLIGLHNAAASGTWSVSVPAGLTGDKRRNDTELSNAILSSDLKVCFRIAGVEGHGYRSLFMAPSIDLAHGQMLPDHIGPPGQVKIKYVAGDTDYRAGKHDEALTLGDIERWRANLGSAYAGPNHAAAGSLRSGYYVFAGGEVFFTGHSAIVQLANVARTLVCQAPEAFEDLVLADAYLMTKKDGDKADFTGLITAYAREGYAGIEAGGMSVPALQLIQERAA